MVQLGLRIWGRKPTELKCPSHCIISRLHALSRASHCWCWPLLLGWGLSVRSPHRKVTLFSLLSILSSVEGSHSAHHMLKELWVEKYAPPPCGRTIYINYLQCYMRDSAFLPIHLFNHLYHYTLVEICFILWIIIQYYIIYSTGQIILALAFGSSNSWVLYPFDIPPSTHTGLFFLAFLSSVALQDAPGSSCIFPAPALEINHVCQELWFLLLENSIRNQDLGTGFVPWYCLLNYQSCVYIN